MYTWTHVAASYNGAGVFRLYINGLLVATDNRGTTLGPITGADFAIGTSGSCKPLAGMLDDVKLFNRMLSDAEIQSLIEPGGCSLDQVTALQAQVTSLENQIAALQAQITNLQGQVTTLQGQVADLQGQITILQTQVTTLQSQLNQLNSTATQLVSNLQTNLRQVFGNPTFVVPGATPMEQLQAIVQAVIGLNKGQKTGVYTNLGG